MRAKSKRIQTTHDICKFYLHLYTNQQQMNNRSLAFPILLWTVQSEISCVHHLFSVIYAFLFNVVRLPSRGNFCKACKNITIFEKDSWRLFQIIQLYLNLFTPSQVTNVNTYLHMLCTKNKNIFYSSKIDFIQKYRFNFKNLSLVPFYCLKTLT